MSTTFQGTYFDAENLRAHPVSVEVAAGRLWLRTADLEAEVALDEVRFSDRLANLPCQIYLPQNRTIETTDLAAIDQLLAAHDRGRLAAVIHWLETRARVAAAATLTLVVAVIATGYFGLPVAARRAAEAVPDSVDRQAGNAALATFNRLLAPSQLPPKKRNHLQTLLNRLVKEGDIQHPLQLEFRSMGGQNPNAFALPGGIIIVSDELVALANDDELLAVLAHELGHVEKRHTLQSVLRGSAALLVVSTVTGDLSTLTTFSSTIPYLLLQSGYSREFESEADNFAIVLLERAKISRKYFASILSKLEKSRPPTGQDFSYLSTHPSTEDRIQRIDPTGLYKAELARQLSTGTTTADTKWSVAKFDTEPKVISQAPPKFPEEMRLAGFSGEVTVGFIVDKAGGVQEVTVLKSTHHGFDEAAVAAVSQWKFSPGKLKGRPVASRMVVPIVFNLEDPVEPSHPPESSPNK